MTTILNDGTAALTGSAAPVPPAAPDGSDVVPLGGGWFRIVADGVTPETVQGEQAARDRLAELVSESES